MSPDEKVDGQDSTDPPGAVSDQNREEAEAGHAGESRGAGDRTGDGAHGSGRRESGPSRGSGGSGGAADSAPGSASEGSQATGHPENAG
jgi:hypothetical protein